MIRTCATLVALCGVLAACGSVPPAPVDHYYRLQPSPVASSAKTLPGPIAIEALRADSLYAERPIVFSEEANPRQLRQYHYHLWIYVPAQVVQDHLVASLGGALDLVAATDRAPWHLEGRIVRFERMLAGKQSKAVAALELNLVTQGRTVLAKTYRADQIVENDSFSAFAAAMEQALARIYGDFLRDMEAASLTKAAQN